MLKTAQRDEFEQAANQMQRLVSQVWQRQFGEFCPVDSWSPPVNLYQVDRRLEVCVDIAGMQARDLDVRVEPGRLLIRGFRAAPEPPRREGEPMQIIAMEIDYGQFCRVVNLPREVDLMKVTTEYRDGLLWVRLPLREEG